MSDLSRAGALECENFAGFPLCMIRNDDIQFPGTGRVILTWFPTGAGTGSVGDAGDGTELLSDIYPIRDHCLLQLNPIDLARGDIPFK